jgi:hypothetical protein
MENDELERYLNVGRHHSVVVDVREFPEMAGIVRVVTVGQGNEVTIEYDLSRAYVEGDIEGSGPRYMASYQTLEMLIDDLSDFLGKSPQSWRNYTNEPFVPTLLDVPDASAAWKHLEQLVRTNAVPLPRKSTYEQASIYWRHIAKYGVYRPDKLLEEENERYGPDDENENK